MSSLQDRIDALLPTNGNSEITASTMRGVFDLLTSLIDAARQGSGFDREDESTLGIIQFCHRASTGVIYQIESDAHQPITILTSQTHFADGTTAIADLTVAQYHDPGETSFSYWFRGEWVEETGIKTLTLPNTDAEDGEGGGYVHYNDAGNLQVATSGHEMIVSETLLTYLYWNTDIDQFSYFADERHGLIKDPMSHKYEHNTIGFAWAMFHGDIDIEGLSNNGNTFSGVNDGAVSDEDMPTYFSGITEGAHMYRSGALGQWVVDSTSNALGIFVDGDLVWNNNDVNGDSSMVWGLTKLNADNDFISPVFFLTNNKLHPLMIGCSQYWKTSRSIARERMLYQYYRMKTDGLPGPEMLAIGSMIIHDRSDGQIEIGSDDELWVCLKRGHPVPRFEDEDQVDG